MATFAQSQPAVWQESLASSLEVRPTIAVLDLAHELNQPLTVIRALAQELRERRELREDIESSLDDIENQALRMMRIIEHWRTFSRDARSGRTAVQVNEVVQGALDMIRQQLRNRGVDLRLDLADSLPEITANPTQIEQVILNLLTNARDALESESDALICIRTWEAGDGRPCHLAERRGFREFAPFPRSGRGPPEIVRGQARLNRSRTRLGQDSTGLDARQSAGRMSSC